VPLAPAGQLGEARFDSLPDLPARLRLFVDAYGLTDRTAILPALRRCKRDEPKRCTGSREPFPTLHAPHDAARRVSRGRAPGRVARVLRPIPSGETAPDAPCGTGKTRSQHPV